MKENNWLIATPNNPHAINKGKSFGFIFSIFLKEIRSQNNKTEPKTRKSINTFGVTNSGITPFAKTWLAP